MNGEKGLYLCSPAGTVHSEIYPISFSFFVFAPCSFVFTIIICEPSFMMNGSKVENTLKPPIEFSPLNNYDKISVALAETIKDLNIESEVSETLNSVISDIELTHTLNTTLQNEYHTKNIQARCDRSEKALEEYNIELPKKPFF